MSKERASQSTPNCPRTERVIAAAASDSVTPADVLKRLAVGLEALCRQLEQENNALAREHRETVADAAAEARWQERQGSEYGSF